jgi:hypothetical protein
MMKYLMNEIASADAVDGPVVIEGGRSPSTLSTGQGAPPAGGGPTSGPLAPGQRWSAARKREVVLRLMRGESAELLSRELGLPVFKLVMAAAKTWRRLNGENQLPKLIQGVTSRNGVEVISTPAQSAA